MKECELKKIIGLIFIILGLILMVLTLLRVIQENEQMIAYFLTVGFIYLGIILG